jgi:hypothetical protein
VPAPAGRDEVELRILLPAFSISELRRAFEIGFLIFVPFLVIDMVVACVLMSMGMMMLPPVMVSLPFKVVFFVLVDGWSLVVGSLRGASARADDAGRAAGAGPVPGARAGGRPMLIPSTRPEMGPIEERVFTLTSAGSRRPRPTPRSRPSWRSRWARRSRSDAGLGSCHRRSSAPHAS